MSGYTNKAAKSTIAIYYEDLLGPFKRNEQAVMTKLDNLAKGAQSKKTNMNDAVDSTEKIRQWDDHMWHLDKLQEHFNTSKDKGLNKEQVTEKFKLYGENALTEKAAMPWYCVFLQEQTGFFSLLLWFGAALCFIGYGIQTDKSDKANLYLGIVLAFVVFVTGCFSYAQTSKAASLMAEFKNLIPKQTQVLRDAEWQPIDAKALLPGDVIKIGSGESVPADVVLFEAVEMKVSNASLTGESEDLLRVASKRVANIFESPNVAFFGTLCTGGSGTGIVIRTGDDTVIGRIANLSQSAESAETPLSMEIDRFIKIISAVAIFLGVTFFIFGLAYGYDIITCLVFAIGIIVANVPEGLLATVTVSLALTARRMHKKMVLVKNLESVETLGSTSCICSDKTGTLTQNRMSVSNIFVNMRTVESDINWEIYKRQLAREMAKPEKDQDMRNVQVPKYDFKDVGFKALVHGIALSTTTRFGFTPEDKQIQAKLAKKEKVNVKKVPCPPTSADVQWIDKWNDMKKQLIDEEAKQTFIKRATVGDASETGLIKFVQPLLMDKYEALNEGSGLDAFRAKYPILKNAENEDIMIPFSSDIKFNMIMRDMDKSNKSPKHEKDNICIFLKGAPEKVLVRCTKIAINNEDQEFTDGYRRETQLSNDRYGKLGERVLAFSRCYLDPAIYTKDPVYGFDVKTWKSWYGEKKFSNAHQGWFPMWDLTLLGLVSLNDPPRPKVDVSVKKCQMAGIKVIMVTGDQPPTAAAIAHKVNIITEPELEYNWLKEHRKDLSDQEAWYRCRSVVIHGDELAREHNADEALEDIEIEKGRKIMDWLRKDEVVFARTTPSQKLLIVDACQKLGHVVAVTGDGVNDSPAIKKADIGVAMGSGSDVAQNAADMLLLDDNFSSIVNGVEEGRLIFDNLKKSIAYTLSSNIPEISPFIMFIIFQVPLPLSTVLILCIDLGTDMVPAISFAYENPELDIMERFPRNSKRDHLVNTKLISFAYLQIGMVQAAAGFFTYFYILNDYGLRPATCFNLNSTLGYAPKATDIYNGSRVDRGNSNWGNKDYERKLLWDFTSDNAIDFRLFYTSLGAESWSRCRWMFENEGLAWFKTSHVSGTQICYTTEALKYAQGGYLISIVCVQWADLLICKTRNLSISQQGMINWNANFGLFFETALVAILSYVPFLNTVLGTRPIACPHFAVPSFSFFTIIFFYDEIRKLFLRNGMIRSKHTKRVKFDGWTVRNTYY